MPHFLILALMVLSLRGFSDAVAQTAEAPQAPDPPEVHEHLIVTPDDSSADMNREHLLREVRRYTRVIGQLQDSLAVDHDGGPLSEEQRLRFEQSIDDIGSVIAELSSELSTLELEVRDNTISFVDERGDGIVIRIPEDLDQTLSEGFEAVTRMVLEGMPDTLALGEGGYVWNWSRFGAPEPPPARRVSEGNIVRVWDDLFVAPEEDVRGNVVVVFGDVEIHGRVEGSVVVAMGNLRLDEAAEITGEVVTVGGRLDRAPGAQAGDVVVVSPFGGKRGIRTLFSERGWGSFLVCQGLFLVMLVVALAAAVAAPEHRFRSVLDTLRARPAAAGGAGAVMTLVVHLAAIVLAAILVLTVVGLPLALLVALALGVAGVVATSVVAAAVGEWVCSRRGGCSSRALAVAVGMFALHVPSFLGALLGLVPAVGGLAIGISLLGLGVKAMAYLLGIGALVLSRFGGQRTPSGLREAA